jgi:4-hydroxybenzoate polyprenyltransferase
MSSRWWTYQKERFPIIAHGPLIAAFSSSAVCYSAMLRGSLRLPAPGSLWVAFLTAFIFFLQLRIADEFKDFEEDSRFRPYRPVPRGLVQLRELSWIGVAGAIFQLLLALLLHSALGWILLGVWIYLSLMSKEFFVDHWIKRRPITYLWTHMLIMPLIDFYATACDWVPTQGRLPRGLFWFLILSFFNGTVVEIGRKIRAPEDEENGVPTYTALWGRPRAILSWLGALLGSAAIACRAAREIYFLLPVLILFGSLWTLSTCLGWQFLQKRTSRAAHRIEAFSGVWTLCLYLCLGVVSLLIRTLCH